jgi:hypothetical protein
MESIARITLSAHLREVVERLDLEERLGMLIIVLVFVEKKLCGPIFLALASWMC